MNESVEIINPIEIKEVKKVISSKKSKGMHYGTGGDGKLEMRHNENMTFPKLTEEKLKDMKLGEIISYFNSEIDKLNKKVKGLTDGYNKMSSWVTQHRSALRDLGYVFEIEETNGQTDGEGEV